MVQTDESNVRVNFRVVGIYCFITGYTLGDLGVTSGDNIQTVQNAVKSKYNDDNRLNEDVDGLKIFEDTSQDNVLTGFAYTFRQGEGLSEIPFDAIGASRGRRELCERIDDATQLVWQYYVSANLERERDSKKIIVARDPRPRNDIGGSSIQPKYHETPLNQDLPTDLEDYRLKAYNIIWRLLKIDISAEGLEMKEKRRQRTSGRIV